MADNVQKAISYATNGFFVFPCAPGGKQPLTLRGYKDASDNADVIRKWWENAPSANIGLVTNGLLVVDVDGANNPWPGDGLVETLDGAPIQETPRGGRHYVFRSPDGYQFRNTASKIAPNVDTRGEGGYIIVSPSIVNDKSYKWLPYHELRNRDDLPEPPQWLIDLLIKRAGPAASTDGAEIPEGARNSTLTSLGGVVRNAGASVVEVQALLLATNETRCNPPLPDAEVIRIANSIGRYEPKMDVSQVDLSGFGRAPPRTEKQILDPGAIPENLLHVPGLIGNVVDWCMTTAPHPSLILALGGALALQSVLVGRNYKTHGGVRANVYILCLSGSGSGKEHPRKINSLILHDAGAGSWLGERFASGPGLEDAMLANPCRLYQTDEIAGLISVVSKSRDERHSAIIDALNIFYTASGSTYTLRSKVGRSNLIIHQPHLVLLGSACPGHYYGALSETMLQGGFLARTITLEDDRRSQWHRTADVCEVPENIAAVAKWWVNLQPDGNLEGQYPRPQVVCATTDAERVFDDLHSEEDDAWNKANDESARSVTARFAVMAEKLALLYATSENREHPVINKSAAMWGGAIARHQMWRTLHRIGVFAASNDFHGLCLKFIRAINEAGGEMSQWQIRRKLKVSPLMFKQVSQALIEERRLETDTKTSSGRPGIVYRLIAQPGAQ